MLMLEHNNIAPVHQLEVFSASCNVVYDLLSGGSLRSLLEQFHVFEEHLIQAYCYQLMEAIKYVHMSKQFHGNINCQNILLDIYGTIKLADYCGPTQIGVMFGVPRQGASSADYTQPLNLEDLRSSKDVVRLQQGDILGIGISIYEMVTGEVVNDSNANF